MTITTRNLIAELEQEMHEACLEASRRDPDFEPVYRRASVLAESTELSRFQAWNEAVKTTGPLERPEITFGQVRNGALAVSLKDRFPPRHLLLAGIDLVGAAISEGGSLESDPVWFENMRAAWLDLRKALLRVASASDPETEWSTVRALWAGKFEDLIGEDPVALAVNDLYCAATAYAGPSPDRNWLGECHASEYSFNLVSADTTSQARWTGLFVVNAAMRLGDHLWGGFEDALTRLLQSIEGWRGAR